MSEFLTVTNTADLAPGEMKLVDLDGEAIAIANVDGEYFAFNNTCPHIGGPLAEGPTAHVEANPYTPWINMYASDEYQAVAADEQATINRLMAERGGPGRLPSLTETFRKATRLEAAFWKMGMHAVDSS